MVSINSTISFIVLLLVTYSYSAPLVTEFESSTVEFEITNATVIDEFGNSTAEYEVTNATVINEENSTVIQVELTNDMTTIKTNVPVNLQMLTSSEESDSGERRRALSRESRVSEDSSYSPMTESNETTSDMHDKRDNEDVEDSTVTDVFETTSEIHDKREIGIDSFVTPSESTIVEDSTVIDVIETTSTGLDKRDMEDSTAVDSIEVTSEGHEKRGVEESTVFDISETTSEDLDKSSVENVTEISSSPSVEDFLFTTMESKTTFNSRAIGSIQSEQEMESSTTIPSEYQPEMTTYVQPSSSIDTFVKYTGLLRDETSTTIESETSSQSDVDMSTESSITSETVTKIISVIPGEVSGPKIVIQPIVQKELSQGQNQSIIEEKKSDH